MFQLRGIEISRIAKKIADKTQTNTLRPAQNGRHLVEYNFKYDSLQ